MIDMIIIIKKQLQFDTHGPFYQVDIIFVMDIIDQQRSLNFLYFPFHMLSEVKLWIASTWAI